MTSCTPIWLTVLLSFLTAAIGVVATHLFSRSRERTKSSNDAIASWRNRIEKQREQIVQLALKHYTDEKEKSNTKNSALTIMLALKQLDATSREVSPKNPSESKRYRDALRNLCAEITGPPEFQDENRDFVTCSGIVQLVAERDEELGKACRSRDLQLN